MTFLLVHWSTTTRYNRFHISHFCKIENSYFNDVKSVGKQNYCDKFLLCKILRLVIIETLWTPLFKLENIFLTQICKCNQERKSFLVKENHIPVSWLSVLSSSIPKCHGVKTMSLQFSINKFPENNFCHPFCFYRVQKIISNQ